MLQDVAARQLIVLCAVLLGVAAQAQESTLSATTVANNPGSAFVYVPSTTVEGAIATGASSTTSLRTVTYWPALAGMGISQSTFTLAPCAVRSPHLHLRASGLLYAYDADSLEVGFVTENGTAITNTIASGASAVFPQGLIHYQFNSGCKNATYTISYGSELPGTQVVTQALFNLPANVLAASLNIQTSAAHELAGQIPTGRFVGGVADCQARCADSMGSLSTTGR